MRFDAGGIDILVADGLDRGGNGLELGQIISVLRISTASVHGMSHFDAMPQATGAELKGKMVDRPKAANRIRSLRRRSCPRMQESVDDAWPKSRSRNTLTAGARESAPRPHYLCAPGS